MDLTAKLDSIEDPMQSDFSTIMASFAIIRESMERQEKAFLSYQEHAGKMFHELRGAVLSLDQRVSNLEKKVG